MSANSIMLTNKESPRLHLRAFTYVHTTICPSQVLVSFCYSLSEADIVCQILAYIDGLSMSSLLGTADRAFFIHQSVKRCRTAPLQVGGNVSAAVLLSMTGLEPAKPFNGRPTPCVYPFPPHRQR